MKPFIRNKRGVSTVIGAIFSVIVFLAGFSFILWEVSQYDTHAQVINERNRLDQDRKNEIIEILDPSIVGSELRFNVTNRGSVTAHIVNIWITEYTDGIATGHIGPISNSTYINPGSTANFTTTPSGLNPELSYMIKVVTERGNVVTKMFEPVVAPGTGGDVNAGPFVLIFSDQSFQYMCNGGSGVAGAAFQIDNDKTRIVFCIQIQNQAGKAIQLSNQSFFLVEVRELEGDGNPGTMEYERYFHIVNSTSTSASLVAYSPDYNQKIPSGGVATLKFGASTVGGTTFVTGTTGEPLHGDGGNGDNWGNLLWTFLVLFWRYEGEPNTFGQTITYAAIRTLP